MMIGRPTEKGKKGRTYDNQLLSLHPPISTSPNVKTLRKTRKKKKKEKGIQPKTNLYDGNKGGGKTATTISISYTPSQPSMNWGKLRGGRGGNIISLLLFC